MPPSPPDVVAAVRAFLVRERPAAASRIGDLAAAASLREAGLLDSILFVTLVDFLETRFSITIPPEDLRGAHLATLEAIGGYVARRLAASRPPPT